MDSPTIEGRKMVVVVAIPSKEMIAGDGCHSICLPNDMLMEILMRLPKKSMFRLRCVSKVWLALLSDPFVLEKLPPTLSGFFYRATASGSLQYASIDQQNRRPPFDLKSFCTSLLSLGYCNLQLLDSCNGLFLFHCNSRQRLIVYDPTAERWVAVSVDGISPPKGLLVGGKVDFDPLTPHFEVVLVYWVPQVWKATFFSSATCRWQTFDIPKNQVKELLPRNHAELLLHDFSFRRGRILCPSQRARYMISYSSIYDGSLDSHSIALPQSYLVDRVFYPVLLDVSSGQLHLAMTNGRTGSLHILVRKGSSWELKHTTNARTMIDRYNHVHHGRLSHLAIPRVVGFLIWSFLPLAFDPNLDVLFLQLENDIYSYHYVRKELERLSFQQLWGFRYYVYPVARCLTDPLKDLASASGDHVIN